MQATTQGKYLMFLNLRIMTDLMLASELFQVDESTAMWVTILYVFSNM